MEYRLAPIFLILVFVLASCETDPYENIVFKHPEGVLMNYPWCDMENEHGKVSAPEYIIEQVGHVECGAYLNRQQYRVVARGANESALLNSSRTVEEFNERLSNLKESLKKINGRVSILNEQTKSTLQAAEKGLEKALIEQEYWEGYAKRVENRR